MNTIEELLIKFNKSSDSISGKGISPDKAWTELFERQTCIMGVLVLLHGKIDILTVFAGEGK